MMYMTETEAREICQTEQTVAYYSGWGGVEIKKLIYDIDDFVVYVANAWNSDERYPKFYGCSRVEYDAEGKPFFRANRHVIPFDECIRC